MHLDLMFVRGEERDCWLWRRDQKVILQLGAYFSYVILIMDSSCGIFGPVAQTAMSSA